MSARAAITITAIAIALAAIAYLAGARVDKSEPLGREVQAAEIKAEQARQIAIEAEARALESRPKVMTARKKVQALATIVKQPPKESPPEIAVNSRIDASAILESLPKGRGVESLVELVTALDEQLELEIQRGDAWKAAFEANQELVEALKKDNRTQRLVAQIMTVVTAAAAVILVVVLL
jgi:hypothetical protein